MLPRTEARDLNRMTLLCGWWMDEEEEEEDEDDGVEEMVVDLLEFDRSAELPAFRCRARREE
jgi:hypothetical protein